MSTSDFIETSQFGAFVSGSQSSMRSILCKKLTIRQIFFGAVTSVGVIWVYFFVSIGCMFIQPRKMLTCCRSQRPRGEVLRRWMSCSDLATHVSQLMIWLVRRGSSVTLVSPHFSVVARSPETRATTRLDLVKRVTSSSRSAELKKLVVCLHNEPPWCGQNPPSDSD